MHFRRWFAGAILILAALLLPHASAYAQTPEPEEHPVYIYLFWGEGCPHCAKAKPYFESLAQKYPQVIYRDYEIYFDAANQKFLSDMAAMHGFEVSGVPTALVGQYLMVGYYENLP